jgi:hypothetical protein
MQKARCRAFCTRRPEPITAHKKNKTQEDSAMAYQNNFLLRESLSDNGNPINHGSYCSSPDIISHEFVNDPQKEFAANYKSDPNQPINQKSKTNPVYTRAMSKQTASGMTKGYIRLYRADVSLFLNSDQWRKNPLYTQKGDSYVTISSQKAGDIAIGNDIFVLDGTQKNYCIVGIVNDSTVETVPDNFKTIEDFILWVHTNPAVAARNFSLVKSGDKNDLEQIYNIDNTLTSATLCTVSVDAENVPDGTVFGLENTALKLDKSETFYAADELSHQVSDSSTWPANYKGYIRVYARLKNGETWPPDAKLIMNYYVAVKIDEKIAAYGHDPETLIRDRKTLATISAPGKLVRVGECTLKFF